MSYLLKALEKAEQERQQQQNEPKPEQAVVVQQASLPKVFIVLALAIVALVAYSILTPSKSADSNGAFSEESLADTQVETSDAKSNVFVDIENESVSKTDNGQRDAKSIRSQQSDQAQQVNEIAPAVPVVNSEKIQPAKNKPLDLVELDGATLSALPSIRFQSHIYSSAAEFRSVMINDRTIKEGMPIAANVRLTEITPDGIVITVNQQPVSLPKGQDWIAPQ